MNHMLRALTCALLLHAPAGTGRAQEPVTRLIALAPGDTLAVHETGAGSPVVIVPGLLGSGYSFRHVIRGLVADGHRVIVIDPLGTGASSRPERGDYTLETQARRVAAIMDSTGVRTALLVCHSVGGSICYRTALLDEDVVGIVAINGGPDERAGTDGLRSAMKFAPLIRILGSGALRGKLRDGLIDNSADASWVTDRAVAAYTAPFSDLGHALRGLRGIAGARDTIALAPRLRDIDVPVTLLVGDGTDRSAMADDDVQVLEQQVPRITVVRVTDSGQYIQEENPAAVLDAIRAMRARLADATGSRSLR